MVVCSVRGIDAPQPCLGICVWRRIDWVNANLYDHQHDCSVGRHETELCLGRLLHRVASITPREGDWQHGWGVLRAEGRTRSLGDRLRDGRGPRRI